MMNRRFSADDCVEYMKKKYGRDFSFVRDADKFQPTANSLEVFVSCPDFPGEDIYVVEEDTGESLRFSDDFPSVVYSGEVSGLLTELAGNVYGECKLLYSRLRNRIVPGSPTSLGEYISDPLSCVCFTVILPPEADPVRREELAKSLADLLCSRKAVCSFKVCYTADRAVYERITSLRDIPGTLGWYTACGHFSTNGSVLTSEAWR